MNAIIKTVHGPRQKSLARNKQTKKPISWL